MSKINVPASSVPIIIRCKVCDTELTARLIHSIGRAGDHHYLIVTPCQKCLNKVDENNGKYLRLCKLIRRNPKDSVP